MIHFSASHSLIWAPTFGIKVCSQKNFLLRNIIIYVIIIFHQQNFLLLLNSGLLCRIVKFLMHIEVWYFAPNMNHTMRPTYDNEKYRDFEKLNISMNLIEKESLFSFSKLFQFVIWSWLRQYHPHIEHQPRSLQRKKGFKGVTSGCWWEQGRLKEKDSQRVLLYCIGLLSLAGGRIIRTFACFSSMISIYCF